MDISEKVNKYICRHSLLQKKSKYIVALSGGADSVALLLILLSQGYNVEAAHCNFHLRGDESNRDEKFVTELCHEKNVKLHLAHFDTISYSQLHKVSIEMAARHLRYSYFEQLSKDIGASGVCVAHHRDDSVETVLINLIRGTGLHGLTGIHPQNGNILRPLLCVSRDEIETFLNSVNQLYVTDSTNLKDDFIRNKIRLNIIPALREINPSISESIQNTSERIYDAIGIFDKSLESAIKRVSVLNSDGIVINTDDLLKEPSSEYILFTILRNYNFSPAMVKQIYEVIHSDNKDKCGKYFESSTHLLVFDRKSIIVGCLNQPIKPIRIPECGNYNFDSFHLKLYIENIYDGFKPSKNSLIATLDAEKINFPLTIRNIENGDKFVPFGMLGKKLVSDYLTDNKKNMLEKKRQLIISDADGNIIWLIGERTDNRYRVNEDTSSVLYLSLI